MPAKNIVIKYEIDCRNLWDGFDLDNCYEIVSNGRRGKGKDFKSDVYAMKNVTWSLISEGINKDGFQLEIAKIDFGSDPHPFNRNPLKPRGRRKNSIKVRVKETTEDYDTKYDISFILIKNGVRQNKSFTIDPRLRVRRRTANNT